MSFCRDIEKTRTDMIEPVEAIRDGVMPIMLRADDEDDDPMFANAR
jgi:hypothetical protein